MFSQHQPVREVGLRKTGVPWGDLVLSGESGKQGLHFLGGAWGLSRVSYV